MWFIVYLLIYGDLYVFHWLNPVLTKIILKLITNSCNWQFSIIFKWFQNSWQLHKLSPSHFENYGPLFFASKMAEQVRSRWIRSELTMITWSFRYKIRWNAKNIITSMNCDKWDQGILRRFPRIDQQILVFWNPRVKSLISILHFPAPIRLTWWLFHDGLLRHKWRGPITMNSD